jgi:hypothetical protein
MKKLIFSIFIASFAICAKATEPLDKLPAIVIDSFYEAQGALVIEYEMLRPFDRVHLTLQSSYGQALKGVKPVLLSDSVEKGKTSVSISYFFSNILANMFGRSCLCPVFKI